MLTRARRAGAERRRRMECSTVNVQLQHPSCGPRHMPLHCRYRHLPTAADCWPHLLQYCDGRCTTRGGRGRVRGRGRCRRRRGSRGAGASAAAPPLEGSAGGQAVVGQVRGGDAGGENAATNATVRNSQGPAGEVDCVQDVTQDVELGVGAAGPGPSPGSASG